MSFAAGMENILLDLYLGKGTEVEMEEPDLRTAEQIRDEFLELLHEA